MSTYTGTHTLARHADQMELDEAMHAGKRAFLVGSIMAPGSSRAVRDLIGEAPVGEPRTLDIMRAFSRGYARQAGIAAREALAAAEALA